jgi:hypothetical protein
MAQQGLTADVQANGKTGLNAADGHTFDLPYIIPTIFHLLTYFFRASLICLYHAAVLALQINWEK